MQLNVQINLGDDAMLTGADLSEALRRLARRLENEAEPFAGQGGPIIDSNGLRVGSWDVVE